MKKKKQQEQNKKPENEEATDWVLFKKKPFFSFVGAPTPYEDSALKVGDEGALVNTGAEKVAE